MVVAFLRLCCQPKVRSWFQRVHVFPMPPGSCPTPAGRPTPQPSPDAVPLGKAPPCKAGLPFRCRGQAQVVTRASDQLAQSRGSHQPSWTNWLDHQFSVKSVQLRSSGGKRCRGQGRGGGRRGASVSSLGVPVPKSPPVRPESSPDSS